MADKVVIAPTVVGAVAVAPIVAVPTARTDVMIKGNERAATTPSTASLKPSFLNNVR